MKRIGLITLIAACGGKQHGGGTEDLSMFQCKERAAEYIVVGGMAGEELGVALDCAEAGPRVRRWKVAHDGTRDDASRSLTPGEFDDYWGRINSVGWANLTDCGKAAKGDPVYTFDVKDQNNTASFSCSGRGELPFPYNALVNELDQAGAAVTAHAHDDPGL